MTFDDVLSAVSGCTLREGASEAAMVKFKQWVRRTLPNAYLRLMGYSNGLEGFVTDKSYLVLWPVELLPELNEAYCVADFAPGLLLIGSDGAEMGYAFDTRHEPMAVCEVSFIGMSLDAAKVMGSSFENFLENLRSRVD